MKLEDQVCSLELAKRLKELGVRQVSEFCWVYREPVLDAGTELLRVIHRGARSDYSYASTFTVAELGEMLPYDCYFNKGFDGSIWYAKTVHKPVDIFEGKTEADARAKMLIHLIEKGIVKVEAQK